MPVFPSVHSWKLSTDCGKEAFIKFLVHEFSHPLQPLLLLGLSPCIRLKPFTGAGFVIS
jgi:hypothetical protein